MSFLVLAVCICLVACEKTDPKVLPEKIEIVGTYDLVFGYGGTEKVEFVVTPADAEFNYDVSSSDCEIKLELRGAASVLPKYFSLTDVSVVSSEEGRYQASITDLDKSQDYDQKAVLRITFQDNQGEVMTIYSDVMRVRMQKAPLFNTLKFLKECNGAAVNKDFTVNLSSGNAVLKSPLIGSPVLVASFDSGDAKVYVDGVEQISGVTANDYSKPVTFTVRSKIEYTFTVQVIHSGLPMVFITTAGGKEIPSKWDDWLSGSFISIYNPDWTLDYEGSTGIRGRGNSTWTYPKKPYALKLDSKAKILGMPKHKRWVLLANWLDRTLLRNCVSFNLAERSGLAYTPRGQFVEVFINGIHKGNYFLCEHIKVDENRVNIDELEEDEIDGGYIMELDAYFDEVNKFKSEIKGLPYMFKDPDEVNEQQFGYICNYVNEFEKALYDETSFASGEYREYIDMESFADWWLVMELTGIWEPNHPKSTYMHKDKGGRLTMGPVWDFDWETYIPMNWFRIKDALYYGRLFQDPYFVSVVKERWNLLEEDFRSLPDFISAEADRIRTSESFNHQMWPVTLDVNKDIYMSFDAAVNSMIQAYQSKLEWLDREIGKM